jgi:ABC-type phosphate/phosphonate transport system ATPase subunit
MNTKDNIILDEPTATLDLLNSSIIIESFIRHNGKIKIITTNDYLTLKLLSNYISSAYNVETGTFVQIKDYINDLIDETINTLSDLPFEMIPINNYNKLKETYARG